ncbi:hypothetical protein C8R41DRAFT_765202 [Lentinula lateritia]|uniref:Uncharacterized protein n=1 Tax=Lentinula lateritia TaxID=40482 RepID=A0ABQ8VFM3_9AGAR|nr:hypothetical protein C8R41DRAFT_765202 [Lentinula lateritia]
MLLNPLPTNVPPLGFSAARHGTQSHTPASESTPRSSTSVNESALRHLLHTNYKISRKTTLSVVYQYPADSILEYPETGATSEEVVGHLFELGMDNWISPGRDFAYSRGEPRGNGKECVTNPLLVHSTTGEMVPCIVRHSTCQGVKICPFFDGDKEDMIHSSATREQLRNLMQHSREQQMEFSSPARDVFERTSAYLTAIRRVGCTSDANLGQDASESALAGFERIALRRGYPEMPNRCTGGLIFQWSFDGTPYIKCEHHSRFHNRDHFFDNTIGNGRFNVEYLEAVLTDDHEEVGRIELEAQLDGYGPRTSCHTIMNNTSQRLTCTWDHRDQENGSLKQPNLISMECRCTFREYEPLEDYRSSCPYILITSRGPHSHPIPLPQKTPRKVKLELESLFEKMEVELADLTPRKFLRHPIVQCYLSSRFPMLRNPMLSDLHISLSNRRLKHLKAQQDSSLEPEAHYIRAVIEIPFTELQFDEDDLTEDQPNEIALQPLKIAICMTLEGSRRFIKTQYLQSDIGFKRIVGFYEFEIASIDKYSNTSITFCRVYLNRQTADAHRLVLREINKILIADTGRGLKWRHLHGYDVDDYDGLILNWVVDQHRGQAKGIGLYLQDLAGSLAPKMDFHQPLRRIQDLSPYDHLRRFLTLCTTHFYRNIRKCAVSEEVRSIMRGLICVQHDDWDGALEQIRRSGGKAAQNWLSDKETSRFVFPAICWEKSYIPFDVWNARLRESNVVEVVHANVNMEGTQCTLVGGVYKGKHYDLLKQRSLIVSGQLFPKYMSH